MSAAGDENVSRLHVAVHNPAVVGHIEGVGNFNR